MTDKNSNSYQEAVRRIRRLAKKKLMQQLWLILENLYLTELPIEIFVS